MRACQAESVIWLTGNPQPPGTTAAKKPETGDTEGLRAESRKARLRQGGAG
jgi:hypothetical protein